MKRESDTHGRPRETVIKGVGLDGGMGIADPRDVPPEDGALLETTWIERRGGACCSCCGGIIFRAARWRKQQIVGVCGCCAMMLAAAAVAVLVWLQSRVDSHEDRIG